MRPRRKPPGRSSLFESPRHYSLLPVETRARGCSLLFKQVRCIPAHAASAAAYNRRPWRPCAFRVESVGIGVTSCGGRAKEGREGVEGRRGMRARAGEKRSPRLASPRRRGRARKQTHLDAANLHARAGQRAQRALRARPRRLGLVPARATNLNVQRRDAQLAAAIRHVLRGEHGRVGRALVAVRLDLHPASHTADRLAPGNVRYVHKRVCGAGAEEQRWRDGGRAGGRPAGGRPAGGRPAGRAGLHTTRAASRTVERRVDVRNAKHLLALAHDGPQAHNLRRRGGGRAEEWRRVGGGEAAAAAATRRRRPQCSPRQPPRPSRPSSPSRRPCRGCPPAVEAEQRSGAAGVAARGLAGRRAAAAARRPAQVSGGKSAGETGRDSMALHAADKAEADSAAGSHHLGQRAEGSAERVEYEIEGNCSKIRIIIPPPPPPVNTKTRAACRPLLPCPAPPRPPLRC